MEPNESLVGRKGIGAWSFWVVGWSGIGEGVPWLLLLMMMKWCLNDAGGTQGNTTIDVTDIDAGIEWDGWGEIVSGPLNNY